MKKIALFLLSVFLFSFLFGGCARKGSDVTVGLLTDGNEVNDYGINEAAYNGIVAASSQYGVNGLYSVPDVPDTDGYYSSLKDLYEQGSRVIIAVSHTQSDAVKKARSEFKDCLFVCIGFSPVNASNVISITFAENEAAFIAGFAAAQTLKTGEIAALLGMDLPSSRRYCGGLKAGVLYSNQNYGTNVSVKDENVIYVGSYSDEEAGKALSFELYSKGVRCIFTDGGKTSDGVFEAAKIKRGSGTDAWVIGAQTDKYNAGIFEGNRSVTLTSAVSKISSAIPCFVGEYLKNEKDLSSTMYFDSVDGYVGIPSGDINIPKEVKAECEEISKLIAEKTITVPDEWSQLTD